LTARNSEAHEKGILLSRGLDNNSLVGAGLGGVRLTDEPGRTDYARSRI